MANIIGTCYTNGPETVEHLAEMVYRHRVISFTWRRSPERPSWPVFLVWGVTYLAGRTGTKFAPKFLYGLHGISSATDYDAAADYELFPSTWVQARLFFDCRAGSNREGW